MNRTENVVSLKEISSLGKFASFAAAPDSLTFESNSERCESLKKDSFWLVDKNSFKLWNIDSFEADDDSDSGLSGRRIFFVFPISDSIERLQTCFVFGDGTSWLFNDVVIRSFWQSLTLNQINENYVITEYEYYYSVRYLEKNLFKEHLLLLSGRSDATLSASMTCKGAIKPCSDDVALDDESILIKKLSRKNVNWFEIIYHSFNLIFWLSKNTSLIICCETFNRRARDLNWSSDRSPNCKTEVPVSSSSWLTAETILFLSILRFLRRPILAVARIAAIRLLN